MAIQVFTLTVRSCNLTMTIWGLNFDSMTDVAVPFMAVRGCILTVWQLGLYFVWQLGVVFWLCDSWGCTLYGSWGLYLDCVTVGVVLIMAVRGCVWTERQGGAVLWLYDYWGTVLWQTMSTCSLAGQCQSGGWVHETDRTHRCQRPVHDLSWQPWNELVSLCVCACVRECVCACACVCVCAGMHACMCVWFPFFICCFIGFTFLLIRYFLRGVEFWVVKSWLFSFVKDWTYSLFQCVFIVLGF